MAALKTKGKCKYCGKEFTNAYMGRHLEACAKRKEVNAQPQGEKQCGYFLLNIYAKHNKKYWLYVEIKDRATLKDLDQFLRDIWLECCGHLSAFDIYGQSYELMPNREFYWGKPPKGMNHKLYTVIEEGMLIGYEYDYGSTTDLQIKVCGHRTGAIRKEKVTILSRNNPIEHRCSICGEAEGEIGCLECLYNGIEEAFMCEECSFDHHCGEEMLFYVCNSPRMAVCGYTGSDIYPERFEPDV